MSTIPTYRRGCWVLARTIPSPIVSARCPPSWVIFTWVRWLTTGITNYTNRKSGGEPAKADAETSPELKEPLVKGHHLFEVARDDDAGNETIDGQNLRHDGAEAASLSLPRPLDLFVKEAYVFCIMRSGRRMPEEKIAPLDLAVPYDAPNTVKTMAQAQPMAPKNDLVSQPFSFRYSHALWEDL